MKQILVPKGQPLPITCASMQMQPTKVNKRKPMKKKPSSHITSGSTTQQKPTTLQSPQPSIQNSMKYRWIPKSILQAQGYYKGQQQIWLPTKLNPLSKTTTLPQPTSQTNTSLVATTSPLPKPIKQVWCPKQQPPKSPTIKHRAQLLQQVFLHQLPQAAAVRIITALQPKTPNCA